MEDNKTGMKSNSSTITATTTTTDSSEVDSGIEVESGQLDEEQQKIRAKTISLIGKMSLPMRNLFRNSRTQITFSLRLCGVQLVKMELYFLAGGIKCTILERSQRKG